MIETFWKCRKFDHVISPKSFHFRVVQIHEPIGTLFWFQFYSFHWISEKNTRTNFELIHLLYNFEHKVLYANYQSCSSISRVYSLIQFLNEITGPRIKNEAKFVTPLALWRTHFVMKISSMSLWKRRNNFQMLEE